MSSAGSAALGGIEPRRAALPREMRSGGIGAADGEASGGDIWAKMKGGGAGAAHLALCRPSGWACHWRKIGAMAVLAQRSGLRD